MESFACSSYKISNFEASERLVGEQYGLLVSNEKLREEVQIGIDQADKGELHDHDTVFGQLKVVAAEASRG